MASSPRARGRQVNGAQVLALLLAFVLIATVGGILAAGVALPMVAVAKTTTDVAVTTFDDLPTELEQKPLSEASTMLAADGTVLAKFWAENRNVVPLDQVAPIMQAAVIATEDKRFYEHGAIDPTGMLRATVKNAMGGNEGASTLTQQYVKNVLVETAVQAGQFAAAAAAKSAEGAQGYSRKLREAKLAIALEKTTPKPKILEGYLNIAQFGVSVYGIESAAQTFFSKPAAQLTYLEAATLAGITKSPTKYDPIKNPVDSQARRHTVLGLMRDQGLITEAEYATGDATPIADTLHPQQAKVGCLAAGDVVAGSGYFCDYVTKVMINDQAFGETVSDRKAKLYRGGLTITTSLDPRLQTIADTEVKAGVPVDDPSGVGSAISAVEPGTGLIKAMAQNRIYNPAQTASDRETSTNYNAQFDYGGSQGFAAASTMKPFTLAEWLKEGHSLNEVVDGTSMTLPMKSFKAPCTNLAGPPYKFGNSEGGSGIMTVLDGTMNSVNSVFLKMGTMIDLCEIFKTAGDMGVKEGGGLQPKQNGPYQPLPGNIIGSDAVAPLTMAGAYAGFAANGVACDPIAITSVKDRDGNELPIPSANCHQGVEPRIAAGVDYALSNVWKGTGKPVGDPGFTSAGKTGTGSYNEHTWFDGFTPLLAAAVWVGFPDTTKSMKGETINGTRYRTGPYGASIAGPTWKRFMVQAMAGLTIPDFAPVGTNELNGVQIQVPNVLGRSVADATAMLEGSGFSVTVAPDQVASAEMAGTVGTQSPNGGSKASKGSSVTLAISNGQAPAGGPGQPGGGGPGAGGNNNGGGNNGGGKAGNG